MGASLAIFGSSDARAAQDAPATSNIAAEFTAICESFTDSEEPYYGEKTAQQLRAMESGDGFAARPAREKIQLWLRLGWEELKLGNPLASIDALESAVAGLEAFPGAARAKQRAHGMLIVAHLQAAEDENCVAHHQSGSCILPIGPDGVHRAPKHARLAGDLSLELLESQRAVPSLLWSLNISRMVAGLYPGGVPEAMRLPQDAFDNDVDFPRWRDVAPKLGVNALDLAGGAIMDDFDGDGHLDLISSSCHPCDSMKAFRNDGEGGFEDVTKAWGLDVQRGGLNIVHADFNNDGALDLLVLRGGWLHSFGTVRNSLLRNDVASGGGFVDVTRALGIAEPALPTQTAAWADYDLDGDLDVYIGNEGSGEAPYPSQLFRNDGKDGFVDVAQDAGVVNRRYTKAVTWGDYDNDGDPDLYVSTNNSPNRLYRNNGDGTFTDVAEAMGVMLPARRSFATWFFDYDHDGWLDLFVGNFENPPAKVMASYFGAKDQGGAPLVYHNDEGKGFTNRAAQLGLTRPLMPMGANYGDLDNDGWLDIYLGTGEPAFEAQVPNVMYRNVGGKQFEDVTFAGGFGHIQKGHGIAFGDVDGDGDQDIFHQIGGFYPGDTFGNALFENPGNKNAWIKLALRGTRANSFGLGARIQIDVDTPDGPRSLHRVGGTGGSFGGSSLNLDIGLGNATAISRIQVRWPGGDTQIITSPPMRDTLTVTEPQQKNRSQENGS